MRTLTHVSVSPTIVTGRLHERGGRGDGEPTIYIIVASSLGTHTFVFIGRRRGGKATDGIFGPVRPEILRWEDRISFYFAFTSFSSPSRHHFLAFLRRFFYHFSSRRYQEIHRARPQHPRHGFGNQGVVDRLRSVHLHRYGRDGRRTEWKIAGLRRAIKYGLERPTLLEKTAEVRVGRGSVRPGREKIEKFSTTGFERRLPAM